MIINLVKFSPGSWEEFGHVGFHLGLRDLLGNEEDFSARGSGLWDRSW